MLKHQLVWKLHSRVLETIMDDIFVKFLHGQYQATFSSEDNMTVGEVYVKVAKDVKVAERFMEKFRFGRKKRTKKLMKPMDFDEIVEPGKYRFYDPSDKFRVSFVSLVVAGFESSDLKTGNQGGKTSWLVRVNKVWLKQKLFSPLSVSLFKRKKCQSISVQKNGCEINEKTIHF